MEGLDLRNSIMLLTRTQHGERPTVGDLKLHGKRLLISLNFVNEHFPRHFLIDFFSKNLFESTLFRQAVCYRPFCSTKELIFCHFKKFTQPIFTYLKLTIETLELPLCSRDVSPLRPQEF